MLCSCLNQRGKSLWLPLRLLQEQSDKNQGTYSTCIFPRVSFVIEVAGAETISLVLFFFVVVIRYVRD